MDYKKHYDLLMSKSRNRTLEGYVEKHHVIPKCLGGSNDPLNIVRSNSRRTFCCSSPNQPQRTNNKMFGWLRKKAALASSKVSRKPRKKETKPRKKRTLSEEHKIKIGKSRKGYTHSEETKLRIKLSNIGKNKGKIAWNKGLTMVR